jgi:hypothetical protein
VTDPAPCNRFEREGLLALEQGRPLDPHFDACPACRETRAAYERLGTVIAIADDDLEPRPDWQARVWAEVARRDASQRRPWWSGWLVPAGAVAALALVLAARWLTPVAVPGLTVTVRPGHGFRRGAAVHPGDRLDLLAVTGGADHAELRVYRDDSKIVLRCDEEAPCRRRGRRLEAPLMLPSIGSYQTVLLTSDSAIVPPTGLGLDADAAAALDAGVRVDLGDEVLVE